MFLAVDIGNSAIKFGILDGETLLSRLTIPTKRDYTNDEIIAAVSTGLDLPVENSLVCSVVPELDDAVSILIAEKCGVNAEFVRNDMDFGLKIRYEPLSSTGSDRLVNSFAAAEKYGVPCMVCSFGTATTVDIVNSKRELIGGLIAPGMATMAKALHLNTAKLPEVTPEKPPSIIARNTEDSIRSGIYYGHVSMTEGLVSRIFGQIGEKPTVVATGGFAETIANETNVIDILDEDLLLEGLNLLFKRLYTGSSK